MYIKDFENKQKKSSKSVEKQQSYKPISVGALLVKQMKFAKSANLIGTWTRNLLINSQAR